MGECECEEAMGSGVQWEQAMGGAGCWYAEAMGCAVYECAGCVRVMVCVVNECVGPMGVEVGRCWQDMACLWLRGPMSHKDIKTVAYLILSLNN